MKKKLLMALLVGVLAVPSSVSCFAAESTDAAAADSDEEEETEETEAEDKDTTAKKKENLKTVGEKKDGCIAFKLRNATSKKIIGLAIKTADETEFPENMMEADDVFELKEKKRVYFSKENSEAETAEETSEDTAPTYDMQLTFEDGTTADVHGIVLEDLGTLTLREKDGIIYGTYKLKSTKEKKSTYDTEKAIADQAAADAAAAQAAADRRQLHSRQRVMITPTTTMIILTIIALIIPMIMAVGMIIVAETITAAVMTAETAAWIMVF